jgi:hypothetical protein
MRRLAVCGFVVLAVGLVPAPGALSATGARHAAAPATRYAAPAGTIFQRLGTGARYAISGQVLDLGGTAVAGAEVDWGWWDADIHSSDNHHFGGTNMPLLNSPGTDATGHFSFDAVTSAPTAGRDDLTAWYPHRPSDAPSQLEFLETWDNDFVAAPTYELRPGAVDVTIAGLTDAMANGESPEVWVAGTSGLAKTSMTLTNAAGAAFAPSGFNDVVAGFYTPQGDMTVETQWQGSDVSVTPGTTDTTPVALDWGQAHHASLVGPLWQHSGRPGSIVKLRLKGWPANEVAAFSFEGPSGFWYYPVSSNFTSTGPDQIYTASLRVPTGTAPDLYALHAYRADDPNGIPDLWTFYQVCTFKSSASAIHHGKSIRLSGKVPAGAGTVTIYSAKKAYGQPATLAAKGWVRVGSCKLKAGKFAGGLLHPKHTTWYVAKYTTGYAFPAFTSVVKVTVH